MTAGCKHPLAGTLPLLHPCAEQNLLLRACLLTGQAATEALLEWLDTSTDPVADLAAPLTGGRLLAPLLADAVTRERVEIPPSFLTCLRAAATREERRAAEYWKLAGPVLQALEQAGIRVLALKGLALETAVYPEPGRRHSHDLDLLVAGEDRAEAARIIMQHGFRNSESGAAGDLVPGHLVHASGLPLILHTGLFLVPRYNRPLDPVWARSRSHDRDGTGIRILSPADHLHHICAHAATGGHRDTLLWVIDAWFILASSPALDWDVFLERARLTHTGLPLAATLSYLHGELQAPIPTRVLTGICRDARRAGQIDREFLLKGMTHSARVGVLDVLRATNRMSGKRDVLRWRLLPSPEFIRWESGAGARRSLAGLYLRRLGLIFRQLGRRLFSRRRYLMMRTRGKRQSRGD